jgi:hypothetical protein
MLVFDLNFSSFTKKATGDHTPDSGLTSVPNSKNSTSWYGRLSAEKNGTPGKATDITTKEK